MESKTDNTESRIVTVLTCIIAVSFAVSMFYYGPSDGIWFTFGLYDQMFGFLGDIALRILDTFLMNN